MSGVGAGGFGPSNGTSGTGPGTTGVVGTGGSGGATVVTGGRVTTEVSTVGFDTSVVETSVVGDTTTGGTAVVGFSGGTGVPGVAGLLGDKGGCGCGRGAGAAPDMEAMRASKSAAGSLALERSKLKWSLPLWYPKVLDGSAGRATARALRAHAKGLAPCGFSEPPSHELQPLQRKLAVQWVELTEEVG